MKALNVTMLFTNSVIPDALKNMEMVWNADVSGPLAPKAPTKPISPVKVFIDCIQGSCRLVRPFHQSIRVKDALEECLGFLSIPEHEWGKRLSNLLKHLGT